MDPPPATATPIFISTATLHSLLTHKTLISHLRATLPAATTAVATPPRHSHATTPTSTLLLMPSFSTSPSLFPFSGVKLVTHHPSSSPAIHAAFSLFSASSGQTLALFDASDLTLFRTASVSALASSYLSREDSRVLIMVGAGNLGPHLIKAHLSVRPGIKRVIIWNRTVKKGVKLAERLRGEKGFDEVEIEFNGCLEEVIGLGDIVSCATNSEAALVEGERLKEGAHLDLVGSFRREMKECDDEAIRRGRVYIDNEAAMEEAGELVGAMERGVMKGDEVGGTLLELIKGEKVGRMNEREITVFKSVGCGLFDLLTAQLVYETYMKDQEQEPTRE